MIRRDYIMRMVQEMVQVLARVVFLRHRQEYDQALREIRAALRRLRDGADLTQGDPSLEDWIDLCRKHEHAASGLMVASAELLREQGAMLQCQGKPEEARLSQVTALGLFLEALLAGETFVTEETLAKVDGLYEEVRSRGPAPAMLRRLLEYFSARGRFARAEDVLFEWVGTGDPEAAGAGEEFYRRLLALDDAELARGELPRVEVEQGLAELRRGAGLK